MFNTPNMLSIFRLCLVPVFILFYFSGLPNANIYALLVFALATVTDFLDGYLARRFHLITNLGKVLDPLGDKMLTFSVLVCLTISGILPIWALGVFLAKELLMGIGGLILHRRAHVEIPPANYIGKTATVLFFLTCGVLVLLKDTISRGVAIWLICGCLAVALAAFVSYGIRFLKIMKQKEN
ncbi:MAG: CDP-diacylglycerol--glycerol-3-phosphate 3-phosphatidyltransferase [Firmicutes bacterium]|nr:CDP-diacylglycerol--glycerol-3-phosphate 3-phosphatidyltransferase [Bacillota bacterium]